jgi:hypothetical protein
VSALRARAEEYLAMRRALGFKLDTQGRQLMSFIGYCQQQAEALDRRPVLRHAQHVQERPLGLRRP